MLFCGQGALPDAQVSKGEVEEAMEMVGLKDLAERAGSSVSQHRLRLLALMKGAVVDSRSWSKAEVVGENKVVGLSPYEILAIVNFRLG